jgi:hypothetical protein
MSAIEDIMRSLGLGGRKQSGSAIPTVSPLTGAAGPQLSPTAKYVADMQALMGGGIGPLSTGQKISAVGQVLQAAGSRGATDPGAVIQNVRNQQMQKLNAQYQIAQLQQKVQEEAAFVNSLSDKERNMFAILDETGKRQFMLARQQGREETDTEKKLIAAGIDPKSPEGIKILKNVAAAQGILTTSGPYGSNFQQASDVIFDGGGTLPDAGTIQGQNANKLKRAVEILRSGKGTVEQFESIFGKGTAAQYLGGGSGNATGGFRKR